MPDHGAIVVDRPKSRRINSTRSLHRCGCAAVPVMERSMLSRSCSTTASCAGMTRALSLIQSLALHSRSSVCRSSTPAWRGTASKTCLPSMTFPFTLSKVNSANRPGRYAVHVYRILPCPPLAPLASNRSKIIGLQSVPGHIRSCGDPRVANNGLTASSVIPGSSRS